MAVPECDVILPLPLEAVMQSAGFSLDIGGSLAKLVYRSKEEYNNGKPISVKEYDTGVGQVHLAQFKRENIQDVIKFLQEKCDVTYSDQFKEIHACGFGGNEYANLLESTFNLRVINSTELDRFIEAMCFLLEYNSSGIFHPQTEEGVKEAKALVELAMHRHLREGGQRAEYYDGDGILSTDGGSSNKSHFPFLMSMMGSGFGFMKVLNRNGNYSLEDVTYMSGRLYLGLCCALTQLTDFASLYELVEEAEMSTTESTVNTQYKDIVSEVLNYATNVVDSIGENNQLNFRWKSMDKLLTAEKDVPKLCDIVHSVLETVSEHIANVAYYAARVSGVKRIYFVGNFVHPPIVKKWVTQNLIIKNGIYPKEEAIEVKFVQNGGHMGAIGAYLLPYILQKESKEASTNTE